MAKSSAANNNIIELKIRDLLYLLEYRKIYKFGGVNNPYANMKWPGIQFPRSSPPC
jgi:hypothetical protein